VDGRFSPPSAGFVERLGEQQGNHDEEFWQITFQSHTLALSQLFSVPVTLIKGKAYVGGQGIDRQDARFVDFLLLRGSGSEAILVEIKTPITPSFRRGLIVETHTHRQRSWQAALYN
jgi:hypothetical protein